MKAESNASSQMIRFSVGTLTNHTEIRDTLAALRSAVEALTRPGQMEEPATDLQKAGSDLVPPR